MALQQIVEETVTGLGYDLVEIERSAGGLLRITIDWPWQEGLEPSITVEDCEKVNRQLQFSLEVDGVEYNRLEISSPGIDRPLRNDTDFKRFVGHLIDITLKAHMGEAAAGLVNASRKKFRGTLEYLEGTSKNEVQSDKPVQWQVVWSDAPEVKPGQRVSKSACCRLCRLWVLRVTNCVRRVWRRLLTSRGESPSCRLKRRHKNDEFGLQHDVAALVNSYRRVVA